MATRHAGIGHVLLAVTNVDQASGSAQLAWADPAALAGLHGEAVRASGLEERHYAIAGLPLRLFSAGPELVGRIAPALAHLEIATPPRPALTVCLWESGSLTPLLTSLERATTDEASNARYYVESRRVQAAYQPSGPMVSVFEPKSERAWFWIRDAQELPYLDTAEPIRLILHWWLGTRGVQMLHGGAVGTPKGGVLVTGRNGSGKSTATLASLVSDLQYAGDDYVAVRLDPEPWLYSLYNSGKLQRDHATRLPHLADAVRDSSMWSEDKGVAYIHALYPERTATDFPLRAVLVPRITDRERARLVPMSPIAALTALAPTTLLQHHPPQPDALAQMATLVRRLPTYQLELGSDITSIPEVILELLETVEEPR